MYTSFQTLIKNKIPLDFALYPSATESQNRRKNAFSQWAQSSKASSGKRITSRCCFLLYSRRRRRCCVLHFALAPRLAIIRMTRTRIICGICLLLRGLYTHAHSRIYTEKVLYFFSYTCSTLKEHRARRALGKTQADQSRRTKSLLLISRYSLPSIIYEDTFVQ